MISRYRICRFLSSCPLRAVKFTRGKTARADPEYLT